MLAVLFHLGPAHLFYGVLFPRGRGKGWGRGTQEAIAPRLPPLSYLPHTDEQHQAACGPLVWPQRTAQDKKHRGDRPAVHTHGTSTHTFSLGHATKYQTDVSTRRKQRKVLIKARGISVTFWLHRDTENAFLSTFVQEDSLTQLLVPQSFKPPA